MAPRTYEPHDIRLMMPLSNFHEVTPNDSTDLPFLTRAVIVGTAGNLVCHDEDGNSVTIPVQAGVTPIQVGRILTASTAANIVAAE